MKERVERARSERIVMMLEDSIVRFVSLFFSFSLLEVLTRRRNGKKGEEG